EVSQKRNEGTLLFSSSSSSTFISALPLRSAAPAAAPGISHERDSREATMRFATKVAPQSRLTAAIAFVVVSILSTLGAEMFSQSARRVEIRTLSSRRDMVSGGDALVEVKARAGAQLSQLTLTLNGKDVTSQLKLGGARGGFRGLIGGMVGGENMLIAKI